MVVLDGDVDHFAGLAQPATSNELRQVEVLDYWPHKSAYRPSTRFRDSSSLRACSGSR